MSRSQIEVHKNRSKGLQKRERILQEAKRLFWRKGFDRTSMRDIATACGCSQGNIYNHFRSKEEVLYRVILNEMERLIQMIQPLENDSTTSPIEQLKVLIERHVEHTLAPPKGEMLHLDIEMRHLSPPHQAEIIRLRDTYDRILRKIIRRGVNAGLFAKLDKLDEKLFNCAIASMIIRARVWYSPEGELSLPELSNKIFELFLNGLKIRDESCHNIENPLTEPGDYPLQRIKEGDPKSTS